MDYGTTIFSWCRQQIEGAASGNGDRLDSKNLPRVMCDFPAKTLPRVSSLSRVISSPAKSLPAFMQAVSRQILPPILRPNKEPKQKAATSNIQPLPPPPSTRYSLHPPSTIHHLQYLHKTTTQPATLSLPATMAVNITASTLRTLRSTNSENEANGCQAR